MDDFRNSADYVAVGHGQFLHAGRIYTHFVAHRVGRFADPGHFWPSCRTLIRKQGRDESISAVFVKQLGDEMKNKITVSIVSALGVALLLSASALGQGKLKDEKNQSQKAAEVFREIMDIPEKEIPQDILAKAECVAVFPQVLKAGFIVGGQGGRGVASCRTPTGWSAPAYFNLGGGSIGLQIGAQATDFVLLFMNKGGLQSLLSNEFTLGADASVAAGPVGRQTGASTDLKLDAQILSYSRSKGLFAGIELKGVVIKPDKGDMEDVYGKNVTAKEVLQDNKATAPEAVLAFPNILGRYSARKAAGL